MLGRDEWNMTDKEKERLNLVLEELNKLNVLIKSKNWDCSYVELESNLKKYIMSDDYLIQKNILEKELTKQLKMFNCACNFVKRKYPEWTNQHDLRKVEKDYGNYFYISLCDYPFMYQNFIFDECGDLILYIEGKDSIQIIDENNFFVNELSGNCLISSHYRFDGDGFYILNQFETSCIFEDSNAVFEFCHFSDSLLSFLMKDRIKVLYNFRLGEIMVDNYDSFYIDLGNFCSLIEKDKLDIDRVRVVKKIRGICLHSDEDKIRKLEFLIDGEGILDNIGVYDFKNDMCYPICNLQEKSQEELLNSIYKQVKLELLDEINVKQGANNLGKCKILKKK